jgi:predicted ester cyclase
MDESSSQDRALEARYRAYLDCLNRRDWAALGDFVAEGAVHNGRALGLAGYRAMLAGDVAAIPDLAFRPALVVVQAPHVACRLVFEVTPSGDLFGLPVAGRRVRFEENVFYRFDDAARIAQVWSVIDRAGVVVV